MSTAPWSLHLLGEVLSAFSVESPTALRDVVSRVAEAVDAEVTAILRRGQFTLCTGLTRNEQPDLQALVEQRAETLILGTTRYHLFWAPLGPEELLVVGRANEPYNLEERALLRGMGRSIQLSTQVLDAVQAEKEALKAEKRAKEAAIREATIDHLTGLPNRRKLLDQLTLLLQKETARDDQIALLFIDLDRFKQINDIHGHKAGDELLKTVGNHLRYMTKASDIVGRISGDEFLIISSLHQATDAEQLAESIIQQLQAPLSGQGLNVCTGASIGIAVAEAGDSPELLLDNADLAMYTAKQQGRGRFARYHRQMRERLETRHQLQEELRRGLANHEIKAWLQPIMSSAHGSIVGFEALARWQHPQRGILTPDQFLDVAEEAGLLTEIDTAVMRDACLQISSWHTSQQDITPRLAINVSAASLADRQLQHRIQTTLDHSGFPARNLFLEITETTLVDDNSAAQNNITAAERMGVRLAIDDFGTGYSSLSYLKRFPVGILKIDRSFIQGIGTSSEDEIIVETVIKMARSLGLELVAEGVESAEQADWLRSLGCHYLQGYYFGAPASGEISEDRYRKSLQNQLGLVMINQPINP